MSEFIKKEDPCPTCGSRGTVECPDCVGSGDTGADSPLCPLCYGVGRIPCPTCGDVTDDSLL